MSLTKRATRAARGPAGVVVVARAERIHVEQGKPGEEMMAWQPARQRRSRKARRRPGQVADGLVVPVKPGNSGGGKEP